MAKQVIGIGTTPNDGTGDTLRDAMDKVNDNFTERYDVLGWGNYADALTTPATQIITTTPSKIQIDGAGASSESGYLPREIRGISELWDVVNDKITPINIGDGYTMRIDLTITARSGVPTLLNFQLDIGGGAAPTIVIVDRVIGTPKTPPYNISVAFPIFSLATFKTNGGQLFLSTDTGTLTIGKRILSIHRISNGAI